MMHYEPHEYSLVFPEMSAEQFKRLSEDIGVNGLLHDIVLFEGKILDGRHRYRACNEQGVLPRFRDYTGTDAAGFVTSENVARRHLSASQLAIAGARLAEVEMERARKRQEASRAQPGERIGERSGDRSVPTGTDLEGGRAAEIVGEKLGIGRRTVNRGIAVVKKGIPEVVKAVENDSMSITEAEKVVKLNPDAQKKIASITDRRERATELTKAINRSEACKRRDNPPPVVELPGTPYVRRFMGRLELMTNDMASEFKLKSGEEIADKFLSEMDWSQPQLRAQLEHITPLLLGLASVYDAVVGKSSAAA